MAEYIKYSDKNPLDAGEETVVRFMKADGVTTKVGSKDIENLVVLIKGNEAEGWAHLLKHYEQFKMAFGIDSKEELKDLISYTCSKGRTFVDNNRNVVIKYLKIDNKYCWVVISKDNKPGIIITAYPKSKFPKG